MMDSMKFRTHFANAGPLVLLAGLWIASLSILGTVRAQIHPDAKTGEVIASKLCSGCHIVGAGAASASMPADVPTFMEIANKPEQTAEAVAGRIVIPHPPMPQIELTRQEIGDVATYIMSLRKDTTP
jgi:mono/diheme cytochrome c family protein